MANVVGTLEVQMLAGMARLEADMKQGNRIVKTNTQQMGAAVKQLKSALGALGLGLGVLQFTRMVKGAIDAQDELSKLSQKININVEELTGWQHAASLGGVQSDQLTKAFKSLGSQMFDASMGLLESQRNFKALNLEIKNSDGTLKNTDKLLLELSDRFAKMEDGTAKSALAVKLLGKAGLDMIPFLNEGSDAVARLIQEGKDLSGVTTESAANAERFNDTLERLEKSVTLVGTRLLNDFVAVLADVADALWEARSQTLDTTTSFSPMVEGLKVLIVMGSEFAYVWSTIGVAMAGVSHQLQGLKEGGFAGFEKNRDEMKDILAELRLQQDAFTKRIMEAGSPGGEKPARGRTNTSDVFIPEVSVTSKIKSDAEKSAEALKKIEDQAGNLIMGYMKSKALLKETTEEAKVRYDIEFGALRGINATLSDTLIYRARELDLAKRKLEQDQEILEFQDLINESDQQQRAAIQETIRLTDAAKKAEEDKLQALRDNLATGEETVLAQYERDYEFLVEQHDKKLLAEEEYTRLVSRLWRDRNGRLKDIEERSATDLEKFNKKTWQNKTEQVFGELSTLSAGVATHSRKMFELNKVAGIADAIVNAYIGISKTLAAYPYPINIAMAAAHGIAAFAQIAAIQSASFEGGGGGAAPSIAGSTPAPPVSPVGGSNTQSGGQTTIINFVGTQDERAMVRRFAKMLNENTHDGGKVVIK